MVKISKDLQIEGSDKTLNDLVNITVNHDVNQATNISSKAQIVTCITSTQGNIVTITLAFHINTALDNQEQLCIINIKPPTQVMDMMARSASTGYTSALRVIGNDAGTTSVIVLGGIQPSYWYSVSFTYISI